MVYIISSFGIVFELFVYKIYGDSDGAFLCGTEILNSRLNEMDFSISTKIIIVIYDAYIWENGFSWILDVILQFYLIS